ncbi:MAG: mechanosensitive ion channel family protein [Candidatus Altiarchaeota archaeon]|nr:mechanosensitive ion channel family protein [Candidatus Altiarchaeota archaeon]
MIESQELVKFDRAHFKSFGNSTLDFEVVYYLHTADYNKYMDTQQAINLGIMDAFEREGIEFAYPTQTIYMGK